MTWNIWLGGKGHGEHNVRRVLDTVAAVRPDVLVTVETYGIGPLIKQTLGPTHQAYQITRDQPEGRDNLWIFTTLPVLAVHPLPAKEVSGFNCGGVRLAVGESIEVDLLAVWLDYRPQVSRFMDVAIASNGDFDGSLVHEADERRLSQVHAVLDYVDSLAGDRPVVLAGDFNTLSHLDWDTRWRSAPGHHGLALPWPVSRALTGAGFVDAFRTAHPDAGAEPGTTFSPLHDFPAPYRIDYIYTRGPIQVRDAWTIDQHPTDDAGQPFPSDHAAVVAQLVI